LQTLTFRRKFQDVTPPVGRDRVGERGRGTLYHLEERGGGSGWDAAGCGDGEARRPQGGDRGRGR
jgi:hypothetical protein